LKRKNLVLDFNNLSPDLSLLLDEAGREVVNDINQFSEEIIKDSKASLASLFSLITSRHSYQNRLFLYMSYLLLIKRITDNGWTITEIRIPNKSLRLPITNYFRSKNFNNVHIFVNDTEEKKPYISTIINLITIFHLCYRFITSSNKKRNKLIPRNSKLILIDTFILQNSIEKRKYIDRYYTGLLEEIPKSIKENVYFVPTIQGSFSNADISAIHENSEEKLIFKQDFIRNSDYLKALINMIKFKLPDKNYVFHDFDITGIVRAEFNRIRFNQSSFRAFLDYYSIRNLYKQKVDISLFIDWNENQVIDKALARGLHDYFPDTHIKGYQGFVTSTDFHFYIPPTDYEVKNKVVVDEICVIGDALKDNMKRYNSTIPISTAPAFRFLNSNVKVHNNPTGILIILPIGLTECVQIAEMVSGALELANELECELVVKSHPATNKSKLKSEFNRLLKASFRFTEEGIPNLITKYKVVIGSASSALMETVSYGTPVIIIGNNKGITQNPIPNIVPAEIWSLCYSIEELLKSLRNYLSADKTQRIKFRSIGECIRGDYFERISEESVVDFLSIKN
jgi:hypothetical protein